MKKAAREIVKKLQERGFEAYFAGGCVRDMLLGIEPLDIDIATSARPDEIEKIFEKTIPVGKQYGIIVVNMAGHNFEVATFRKEGGYFDARHPTHVTFSKAKEDAQRRDFTINGIFYDPIKNKIIDLVGGVEDIKKKTIRFIGDPKERIEEDNLRLVRAIRFKITLGFQYAQTTYDAVRKYSYLIKNVSSERIKDELDKIMASPNRSQGLIELSESGLLSYILPEVEALKGVPQPPEFHLEGDVFVHTYLALKSLPPKAPSHLGWAVLLHDIAKPLTLQKSGKRIIFHNHAQESAKLAEQILKRLKFSKFETYEICWLIENHMKIGDIAKMRPNKRLEFLLDPKFEDLIKLSLADSMGTYPIRTDLTKKLEKQVKEAKAWAQTNKKKAKRILTGDDLIKIGLPPGPEFQIILEEINDLAIEGKIKSKSQAIDFVKKKYVK